MRGLPIKYGRGPVSLGPLWRVPLVASCALLCRARHERPWLAVFLSRLSFSAGVAHHGVAIRTANCWRTPPSPLRVSPRQRCEPARLCCESPTTMKSWSSERRSPRSCLDEMTDGYAGRPAANRRRLVGRCINALFAVAGFRRKTTLVSLCGRNTGSTVIMKERDKCAGPASTMDRPMPWRERACARDRAWHP